MNILCSELFEDSLKAILKEFLKEDITATKKFKLYLDTIIVNLPTKASKYKKSIYFDNDNIKDIPHENFTIVFFMDTSNNHYLILNILPKETSQ
jgi:hypothetical protein